MKKAFTEQIEVPSGYTCTVEGKNIRCAHSGKELNRRLVLPGVAVASQGNSISFKTPKANRKTIASIRAEIAHIRNMFVGLKDPFVYEMEVCNVHFPMTLKVEGNKLVITNFLGEKQKRIAEIVPNTQVEVKGQKVIVSSPSIEAAGQTAANIERSTHITRRDRRVFQDGIFITSKCGRPI